MGLTTPHQKNFLLQNHGGSHDPHRLVAPIKKKNESIKIQSTNHILDVANLKPYLCIQSDFDSQESLHIKKISRSTK
jgi:hypothetical protein